MNTIAAIAGLLFFVAADYKNGRELWVSDGTTEGTHIVANLSRFDYSTTIYHVLPVQKGVVFSAHFYETTGRSAVYFSDGTRNGTYPLQEYSGQAPLDFFASAGGRYYFSHCNGADEFWHTNGTRAGTKYVKIRGGTLECTAPVLEWNNKVVFFVRPNINWVYIAYSYDPKSNKVEKLPIRIESENGNVRAAVAQDKIIFVNYTRMRGSELWVWDESMPRSRLLKDIYPGRIGAFDPAWSYSFDGPITHGGKAFFLAMHPRTGMELWSTDGTAAGTRLVKDIVRGTSSASNYYWTTRSSFSFDNKLFALRNRFLLDVDGEYWITDGTTAGTKRFVPKTKAGEEITMTLGFPHYTTTKTKIFFEGHVLSDNTSEPSLLYSTDLKTMITRPVANINRTRCYYPRGYSSDTDYIYNFAVRGNTIFFSAMDKFTPDGGDCGTVESNTELWATNGTTKGTRLVKDIYPGVGGAIGRLYGHRGSDPDLLTVGGKR